MILTVSKFSPL